MKTYRYSNYGYADYSPYQRHRDSGVAGGGSYAIGKSKNNYSELPRNTVGNPYSMLGNSSNDKAIDSSLITDMGAGFQYFCNCMANNIVSGVNVGEAAGTGGAGYYSYKAWKHASTTPSKTGTPFLVQPMKSSIFRGYLRMAGRWAAWGVIGDFSLSTLKCLYDEYQYFSR